MTSYYERFLALPRARKGATPVIIVEEGVLAKLIYDATWKHPEVSDRFRAHAASLGRPPIQIHVEPAPGINPDDLIDQVWASHDRRQRWSSRQ